MKNYYLGYNSPDDDELTQYASPDDADYNSEEWCVVPANSLSEAIDKYEEAFAAWQQLNIATA